MKLFQYTFKAMGGTNVVALYSRSVTEARLGFEIVEKEVRRIEHKYSRYLKCGIVYEINAAAGESVVKVDDETADLLDFADSCFHLSEGLFDITSGVLRRAWDFNLKRVPTTAQLEQVLPLIGWEKVSWKYPRIRLLVKGMEIDFGGFGKEYAVDRAVVLLRKAGMQHGFVNLNGDIAAVGPRPDGSPWIVGVKHPRREGSVIARAALFRGAIATSGDYERFMTVNGRRYCHILNPFNGWPVSDLQSVTVYSPSCLAAGSMATIAMLQGRQAAFEFLGKHGQTFLIVDSSGEVSLSGDLFSSGSIETSSGLYDSYRSLETGGAYVP
ncbi:MAG: FAD:protein FMN transferase [Candidatus Dadabacteria bacterium]|nr:MAG: FAD:protein FMN transferase [Candidatus Dadabacteria bacterium]